MNVEILKPFVEGAAEVLEFEIKTDVAKGALSLQKSALTTDEVTVLISLIGAVEGIVLFCMTQKVALNLVSKILEQEVTEFDSLAQSGIAELGNVITGRSTVKLSQAGYQVDISPPTVIKGKGIAVSTLDFSRIIVPLTTSLGAMEVHLAVREKAKGQPSNPNGFIPLAVSINA
jgi:chemotaxis protein CheX